MIASKLVLYVLLIYLVFILLLIACAIAAGGWNDTQLDSADEMYYQGQVALIAEDILVYLQQAESNRRGYVITHDPSYAQTCLASIKEVERSLAEFKNLNLVQVYRDEFLDSLTVGVTKRATSLRLSIELLLNRASSDSLQLMLTNSGHALMTSIRNTILEMSSEKRQLASREYLKMKKNGDFYDRLLGYVTACVGLGSLVCCALLVLHIRRRDKQYLKLEYDLYVTHQSVMHSLARQRQTQRGSQ